MRFRTKTILGIAAIEIVMLAILVGNVLAVLRDSNENELVRRVQLGCQLLAAAAKDAVIAQDLATLDSLITEATSTGQIDYVRILDADGHLLAQHGKSEFIARAFERRAAPDVASGLYEWSAPILAGGIAYGQVQMGVTTGPLQTLLASSQRWAGGIAAIEMLLVALFSWILGNYLSRQLVGLRRASEGIAAGNFSHRLAVKGDDELAQTARAFNRMAEQLGDSHALITAENQLRVAAQRQLEQALAQSEDRTLQLNEILELLPDGLVSFDRAGAVKYATPAFLRIVGMPADAVLGRTQVQLEALLRELAEGAESWPGLAGCFAPDPVDGPSSGAATPPEAAASLPARQHRLLTLRSQVIIELLGFSSHSATLSRLLYVRDVTHEMTVDRMKSEFLSHAAHELRTPMTSIFGFTELLATRDFDDVTRQEMLATIHKQTTWLIDIINELLDLSRIEARQGKDFHLEPVAIAGLVREVLGLMNVDQTRWPIRVDLPASLPPVLADAAKLRQVFTNVIGNAIKYSPDGGRIEIRALTDTTASPPLAGIVVADHGIGMTAQQLAHVGERFYRADTSGKIPGSGLGMAIVKEVVDLLGGRIDLRSQPGQGTAVTLWLPLASAAV